MGIVALAGFATYTWLTPRTAALSDRDSILIGAFENTTGDAVFDETLVTALKVQLGQSPFLDIVPDQRIRETLRSMGRGNDERLTKGVSREVCQRLGLKAMLEGSIAPLGTSYVLGLDATDCATGEPLAREQAEATKERVLNELGSISSRMRTRLGESLPSIQRFDVPIEQATTPSLTALKAYALGLEERRRGRELESVAFFNQAIDLDREFAAAYATLSSVYGSVGEWRRSEDYARLAFGLQKRVSERERLFINYQYHDRVTGNQDKAASTLELWKTAYPRESRPSNALALIHHRMGRYERAEEEAREALRRSPGHPFPLSNLAIAYRALGRYADARKIGEEAVKLGVETTPTRRLLYQIGMLTKDGSAAAHVEWAKDRPREFDLVSAQAQVAAFHGRLSEARELYRRASEMAMARNLRGTASGYAAHLAWTEALYRDSREAADAVRQALSQVATDSDGPGTIPRFRAPAALAMSGLNADAMPIVTRAEQSYPEATFVRTVLGPVTRAAMALRQRKPDEALQALEVAEPTELGTVAGLVPPYLRAEAFMQKDSYVDAIREYRKVAAAPRRGPVCADGAAGAARRCTRVRAERRRRPKPPRLRRALHHLERGGRGFPAAARRPRRVRPSRRHDDTPVTSPLRISHYEVLSQIGRDGPTEIYRARDLRLDREVALKVLRREEMIRPAAFERFRSEARIASLVTHPHICTVHDSGEANGQPFLVCELLEGRALDETVAADGPMTPDRVIEMGIQIADALGAAHRRGVVHANLKPSNVFITHDGHAKLLELGAAGAVAAQEAAAAGVDSNTATATPALAITPSVAGEFFHAYLSPEQVGGQAADARSDIFATGALLYEMATGRPAFRGTTLAEIAADISTRAPEPPRGIPPALEAVIQRALEKSPERRYQRASELLDDLRRARRTIESRARTGSWWRTNSRWRTAVLAGTGAVVLLAMTGFARWRWPTPVVERSAILVGDIANGTADPDFDGTLRQAISVYLAQSPYLDLVSDERIRTTLQLMGRTPDARITHEVGAELCQRLGLQAMLEGSVAAVGRSTVVALALTDCHTDATIAKESVEVERKEDVLRALGPLTSAIRRSLGESGGSLARNNTPIEEATTPSLEALKAYTEAVTRRAAGHEMQAVELLERAIAVDPQFALAHTTLSSIYGGFGETGRSEEYARLAYEHRGRVSERERLFITYQYHDRVSGDQLKAREALEVWKRTYPKDYRPSNALALLHIRLGDYADAVTEAEDAMRRNPVHAFPRSNLAHALRGAGRYADARAAAEKAMSEKLETVPMRRLLYQLGELQGDAELARKQIEWAANHARSFDISGARGQVALFHGRVKEARALFARR